MWLFDETPKSENSVETCAAGKTDVEEAMRTVGMILGTIFVGAVMAIELCEWVTGAVGARRKGS